jgi:hypothetical protein
VTQARVAGLEEKLEAALGQLQRRTQQLADAERRNRSLQVHPRCAGRASRPPGTTARRCYLRPPPCKVNPAPAPPPG